MSPWASADETSDSFRGDLGMRGCGRGFDHTATGNSGSTGCGACDDQAGSLWAAGCGHGRRRASGVTGHRDDNSAFLQADRGTGKGWRRTATDASGGGRDERAEDRRTGIRKISRL